MRRSILKLIAESSPQRPACFDTHQQWVQWLASAHVGGLKVVRRVDIGKHRGERFTFHEVLPVGQQSHCADCSSRRREQMHAEQRCFPVRPKVVDEEAKAPRPRVHQTAIPRPRRQVITPIQLALFALLGPEATSPKNQVAPWRRQQAHEPMDSHVQLTLPIPFEAEAA